MKLKTVKNIDLKGKRVLFRVDYDVPTKKIGGKVEVEDDTRIRLTIPTLDYLLEQNCKVIILAKNKRPDGKVVEELRLDPMAKRLSKLINKPVKKIDECIGSEARRAVDALGEGEILMLENTRFHPGETKNDPKFAKELASYGEIIVNDAFSLSHRAHASVVGIAKYLPMVAGFHLQQEVEMLSSLTENPKHPFVVVVGGAKVSDKVNAVVNLAKVADVVLVGGGVANIFLKAEGFDVRSSYMQDVIVDEKKRRMNFIELAKNLLRITKNEKMLLDGYIPLPKIIYPYDVLAAKRVKSKKVQVVDLTEEDNNGNLSKDLMFLDIGPRTMKLYRKIILQANTIFWNGPMGVFEEKAFEEGTKQIALATAKADAVTILGGADTTAAIRKFNLEKRYDHVSAAGGAALDFLAGKKLPGLVPMMSK